MTPRDLHAGSNLLFPSEVRRARFVDLWKWADNYRARFNVAFGTNVEINLRKLYLVVISAYDDIARYKLYHLEDPINQKSDATKRAAFLTKWICRLKPLYQPGEADIANINLAKLDPPVLVNEFFALFVTALHLSSDCGRNFAFTPLKEYELVYDLLFRDVGEGGLLLANQLIVDWVKGTPPHDIL